MISRRRWLAGALGAGSVLTLRGLAQEPVPAVSADLLTAETLTAVERGLAFLARTQQPDGSFGDRQQYRGNLAVTSLAGLALMAGGHQPGTGTYGQVVEKALHYVLSKENRTPPGFLNYSTGAHQGAMYSHGFATLFLAEAHGMIADASLARRTRDCLSRAVQIILHAQNDEGGWRYEPEPRQADVSVTICQIMALRAARNAGIFVPKKTVDSCIKYVRECQNPDGGFNYFRKSAGESAFARSAAGVVALYCAGVYQGKDIDRGLRYLLQFKPGTNVMRRDVPDIHYYYGHYYAAQAMWTAGPAYWQQWFPALREELLQRTRNRGDGVWVDVTTCNHYATAMACIILQIPFNYLPILQK